MLSEGKVSVCRVWGRKLLLQPHRQHTSEDTACPEFSFVSLNEKISQSCRAQKLMCFMSQQQHNQTYITHLIKNNTKSEVSQWAGSEFPWSLQSCARRISKGYTEDAAAFVNELFGFCSHCDDMDLTSTVHKDYSVLLLLEHLKETKATDGRIKTHGGSGNPSSGSSRLLLGPTSQLGQEKKKKPTLKADLWLHVFSFWEANPGLQI